jgi:two-component system, LuxR family, response regulator FixJ
MSERTVYVVDDDDAVRDSLTMLFRNAGLAVRGFPSAGAFLEEPLPAAPGCLVLDIRMPGMSGTALQDRLLARGAQLPIIFITGHGNIPTAVEAVKKGAYDFIEKPFDDYQLLSQVMSALERCAEIRSGVTPAMPGRERLEQLSEREQEVLKLVLAGKPSRQVAEELYISARTVEFHRARIMQKLGVRSAAELVRVCLAPTSTFPS